MSPQEQQEAKQAIQGINFDDLLEGLDLLPFGKKILALAAEFVREHVLPKIEAKSAYMAFILATILEAIENLAEKP